MIEWRVLVVVLIGAVVHITSSAHSHKKMCAEPPQLPHTTVRGRRNKISAANSPGSSVKYTCHPGYNTNSNGISRCLASGRWSRPNIDCQENPCPFLDRPAHGWRNGSMFVFGRTVNFGCEVGYRLVGQATILCQANGKWTDSLPRCEPVKCPRPLPIEMGDVFGEDHVYKANIRYECRKGHRLVDGSAIRSCMANGTWSGHPPTCRVVDCGTPEVKNGDVVVTEGTVYLSSVAFICDRGYSLKGVGSATCGEDGEWDENIPECRQDCPKLTVSNAKVFVKRQLRRITTVIHGALATVRCNWGFQRYRYWVTTTPVCSDGEWHDVPKCVPKPCSWPPRAENGWSNSSAYIHGSVVGYTCYSGYKPQFTPFVTKCHYGEWTKKAIVCEKAFCYPRQLDPDGPLYVRNLQTSYEESESIEFECEPGYVLNGLAKWTCNTGDWVIVRPYEETIRMSNTPTCTAKGCPLPHTDAAATVISVLNGSTEQILPHNSRIVVSCRHGYKMTMAVNVSVCDRGQWSTQITDCAPLPCVVPKVINAIISKDDEPFVFHDAPHGVGITVSCFQRYEPFVSMIIECNKGNWSANVPPCYPGPCDIAASDEGRTLSLVNGSTIIRPTTLEHGAAVSLVCAPRYEPTTPTVESTCDRGLWNPELADCLPQRCSSSVVGSSRLTTRDGTIIERDRMVLHGVTVTVLCDPGHDLRKGTSLKCDRGQWLPETPRPYCNPKPCKALIGDDQLVFIQSELTTDWLPHGTEINVKCVLEDFEYLSKTEVNQCDRGSWTIPKLCVFKSCDRPRPKNARIVNTNGLLVTVDSATSGSVVLMACDSGYVPADDESFTDLTQCFDGDWLPALGSCVERSCELPMQVRGGGQLVTHGESININCTHFLRFYHDSITVKCFYGEWFPQIELGCRQAKERSLQLAAGCRLFDVNNGRIVDAVTNATISHNVVANNSLVAVTCDVNYAIDGAVNAALCVDKAWPSRLPRCTKVSCTVTGAVREMTRSSRRYQPGDEVPHGLRVRVTCVEGYIGYSVLECDGSRWVQGTRNVTSLCSLDTKNATCVLSRKSIIPRNPPPGSAVNGVSIEVTHGATLDYVCRYSNMSGQVNCSNGHVLPRLPDCSKGCRLAGRVGFRIKRPKYIIEFADGSRYQRPGTNLTIKCSRRFIEKYGSKIGCGSDGKWLYRPPYCVIKACRLPANGNYEVRRDSPIVRGRKNSRWLRIGGAMTIRCKSGYVPSGWTLKKCSGRADWEPSGEWCTPAEPETTTAPPPRRIQIVVNKIPVLSSLNKSECNYDFMYLGHLKLKADVVAREHSIIRNDMKLADCVSRCRQHGYRCRSVNIITYDNPTHYCRVSEALPVRDEVEVPRAYETAYLFVQGCLPDSLTFSWVDNVTAPVSKPGGCDRPFITADIIVKYKNQSIDTHQTFPDGAQLLSRCREIGKYMMSGDPIVTCRDGEWSSEVAVCHYINYIYYYAHLFIYYTVGSSPNIFKDCSPAISGMCSITDLGVLRVERNRRIVLYCFKVHDTPTYFRHANKTDTSGELAYTRYVLISQALPVHSGKYTCGNGFREHSIELLVD